MLYRHKCKTCFYKEHLKRVYGNPEQAEKKRIRDRNWRKRNPDNVLAFRARQKDNQKRLTNQYREQLTDAYVVNRLGLSHIENVPNELIEVKRIHIKILRLLRAKK